MAIDHGTFSGTRRRVRLNVVAAIAVVAALLVGFLPGSVKSALHAQGRYHAVAHLVVFLIVGILLNKTSRSGTIRLLLVAVAVLLGFAGEFGEHLVFGMTVEWRDVGVNVLGAMVGTALSECVTRALQAEGIVDA